MCHMLACPGDSCLAYCRVNECIQVPTINNGKCHRNSICCSHCYFFIVMLSLLELILASLWNTTKSLVFISESLFYMIAGLEINILRQWTSGPPALRIWWSGLKSGGPENCALIISYNWNSLQNAYSEAQLINTHSFGTDSLPSEYWITEDVSVGCWWWCASTARPAIAHGLHIAAVVPKQPRKLYSPNLSMACADRIPYRIPDCHRLQSFSFFPLASRRLW